MKRIVVLILLAFCISTSYAQNEDVINKIGGRLGSFGNTSGRKDTIGFEHRNDKKDSIGKTA